MSRLSIVAISCLLLLGFVGGVCSASETETLKTSAGDLKITLVGHGSVMFEFGGKVIHVDPLAKMGDYAKLPQADLILLTHEHGDHLDMNALGYIRAEKTAIVLTQAAAEKVKGGLVMANGDVKTVDGLKIEATPAYNVAHKRDTGEPFHPKGRGNGYVITFGDRRVYVGGDTENIPEMKDLKDIDVAFLPINLPFTMTAAMVTDAAKSFKPKVLIPYHFDMGETDLPKLYELMKDVQGVEARVRTKK